MSKIILVSATPLEHGGLKDINGVPIFQVGIGKINAASNLTEILWNEEPDIVVNFGSCGNLKNHKVGAILEVGEVINDMYTMGLKASMLIKNYLNLLRAYQIPKLPINIILLSLPMV